MKGEPLSVIEKNSSSNKKKENMDNLKPDTSVIFGFAKSSITTSGADVVRNVPLRNQTSKRCADPEKKAKIFEMRLKAKEMRKQLQDAEKRRACVSRIQALESQLISLNNEEAKRLRSVGILCNETSTSNVDSQRVNSSINLPERDDEFDQIRRFCSQIKSGEELTLSYASENNISKNADLDRIRGGAGCGACGLAATANRNIQIYPNMAAAGRNVGATRPSPKFQAYLGKPKQVPVQIRRFNKFPRNTEEGKPSDNQVAPINIGLSITELQKLADQLVNEIDRVRLENYNNRKRIIELCVVLKQKEAAIRECTELLCHIMNEDEDITSVIAEVQGGQLAKHVEYLRWILIRLQFENLAQESEIESLCKENNQKDRELSHCKKQKDRYVNEKETKESNLLQFTMFGTCGLELPSTQPNKQKGGPAKTKVVTC